MNDISRQLRAAKREIRNLLDDKENMKKYLMNLREQLTRVKKGQARSSPASPLTSFQDRSFIHYAAMQA